MLSSEHRRLKALNLLISGRFKAARSWSASFPGEKVGEMGLVEATLWHRVAGAAPAALCFQ